MKVLHIGEIVQGGVATYIRMLLKLKQKENVENYIILADYKSNRIWDLDDKYVKYYRYKRSPIYVFIAMMIVMKHIKAVKPDIVYCHSTWAGLITRVPMLLKKNNPYIIYNAHGWSFLRDTNKWKKKIYSWIERTLSVVTDCIINVSNYEYKAALKYGVPKNRNIIIYSGISDDVNRKEIIEKKGKFSINILYVGRFDAPKGVDILLESFARCKRKDLHLTMIGDGVVSKEKKYNKIPNNITFLGWQPPEIVYSYYERCDVVVMPSRWEAFGLVAVEAMMHGKPVIVSNRGALPELIVNGENGWVFSIEDKDDLINILYSLDKEEIEKRGFRARKIYESKFTELRMLSETLKIYKRAKKRTRMQ